MYMLEIMQ